MSTYKQVRKETAEKMGDALKCGQCGSVTPWDVLSALGRCQPCFRSYCAEPLSERIPGKFPKPGPEVPEMACLGLSAARQEIGRNYAFACSGALPARVRSAHEMKSLISTAVKRP